MKSTTFTTLTLLIFAIACTSPKKKFDNGDYSAAFKATLKNLKNEKKATEADRDILLRSLDKIYQPSTIVNLVSDDDLAEDLL